MISLQETNECWAVTERDGCAWGPANYACVELIDPEDCDGQGAIWNATLGKSGTGTVIFRLAARPQFCADFNADFGVLELYPWCVAPPLCTRARSFTSFAFPPHPHPLQLRHK